MVTVKKLMETLHTFDEDKEVYVGTYEQAAGDTDEILVDAIQIKGINATDKVVLIVNE